MPDIAPFERQERHTRWLTYALAVLLFAAVYSLAWLFFGGLIGFVVCVPILGAYASWILVNHGGAGYRGLRWLALHKVNGNYLAFDDLQVRVEWRDGQCRVAAWDVFNVLHEKLEDQACRRLGISYGEQGFFQDEHGAWWFGEKTILQWLNNRAHKFDKQALRLRLWLEREVFPPLHKKAEIRGLAPAPVQPASIERKPSPPSPL